MKKKTLDLQSTLKHSFGMVYDAGVHLLLFELIHKGLILLLFKAMAKSKTYTKTHTNKKAIANHVIRIKKRGGSVRAMKNLRGTKLVYSFGKIGRNQLDLFS